MKIKVLDMTRVKCPICEILMTRADNEVICPKCGYSSPIILVKHTRSRLAYD